MFITPLLALIFIKKLMHSQKIFCYLRNYSQALGTLVCNGQFTLTPYPSCVLFALLNKQEK